MIKRTVELRAENDGLSGVILNYNERAADRAESFMPGSVRFDDVILNLMHDRHQPVARTGTDFLTVADSPTSLTLLARYPDTVYGRRARELVDSGVLRGLSAEFIAEEERRDGGLRVITKARLYGVGIVDRPAYAGSVIHRDLVMPLEYRQGGAISAFIRYGVPFVVSLARRKKILIPDPLDLADDIFLLDGYDYNRALAATAAGSLSVRQSRQGLTISAASRALRKAPLWPEVRKRMRAGLINGVSPGIMRVASDTYTDPQGFEVERITKGGICEVNLVARESAGELRRRWLF